MKNLNTLKSTLLVALLALLFTAFINFIPVNYHIYTVRIVVFVGVIIILWPFIMTNGKWILYYFFDMDREWWNVKVQRPRILFYIIYFFIFFLLIKNLDSQINYRVSLLYYFSLFFFVFGGMFLFRFKVWTIEFENEILPLLKDVVLDSGIEFRELSECEINLLYQKFCNDISDDSRDDFLFFLKNKYAENKILWKGTSGKKGITYRGLFILLHNMLEVSDVSFENKRRRELIEVICANFVKMQDENLVYKNVNSAYSGFNIKKYPKLIL